MTRQKFYEMCIKKTVEMALTDESNPLFSDADTIGGVENMPFSMLVMKWNLFSKTRIPEREDFKKWGVKYLCQLLGFVANARDYEFTTKFFAFLSRNKSLYKTAEISNAQYFIGCKADKLREEWSEHKFDSDVVKRSVGAIRGLFFQDEKIEAFRKFSCVDIVAPDFWNSNESCIEFEFSNGDDAFSITIPDISPNKYGIGSRGKEAFSEKLWIGRVSVHVFIDKNMNELAISSLDFDEIRNYLEKLVEDFHAEKRNLYDKFMSDSRRYVGASGISNLSWNTASEDDYEMMKREYGHVSLDVLLRRFELIPSGVV